MADGWRLDNAEGIWQECQELRCLAQWSRYENKVSKIAQFWKHGDVCGLWKNWQLVANVNCTESGVDDN